jgi:hypothetical protein
MGHSRPTTRTHVAATALAAAALLIVGRAGDIHATCRCGAGDLELVFVLDATGSMGPVIGTVKAQAERIIEILESQVESLRVGGVAFRTRDDAEMPLPRIQDLTADRRELAAWLRTLRAKAGGDEAVADGLEAAILQMSWTPKARKVVVLIGDEAPTGREEDRLLQLARAAADKGIVIHTITQSHTACLYYLNYLDNVDPAAARALRERYGSRKNLEKSFRLPAFERIAAAGAGRAVGTGDTREIVKWLLAFALGYDDDDSPPDMPKPSTAKPRSEENLDRHDGRGRIGWVRYKGDWRTPRSFDGLVRHLGSLVRIDLDEEPAVVSLSDKDLWRFPILYLSGHGPVALTPAERKGLAAYVAAGGVLWADNCCGKPSFDKTIREQIALALPGVTLGRLDRSHPVFDIGHVISDVRLTAGHRKDQLLERAPEVWMASAPGGGAAIYTPHSLGAGWRTHESGMSCMMHDDDALKLSENIVLFAFSR